jgi:murein DD-endopeptidase MepM/ murein hydrolase activator NlpD
MPIITRRESIPRSCDPGIVWPISGGEAVSTIGDPFGHRTFSGGTGHAGGVDFHRGMDMADDQDGPGQPAGSGGVAVVSPIHGKVIRKYKGYFHFFDADDMTELAEVDPGSKATFTRTAGNLAIVGKNDGTVTFPSGLAALQKIQPFNADLAGNDYCAYFRLASTVSLTGKIVVGIYDATNDQYLALEYNGATFTCKGKKVSGAMTNNGVTATPAACVWGMVWVDIATGKAYWKYSTDGNTWTDIVGAGEAFTVTNQCGFKMFIGWDPAAAGGDDTVNVQEFGGGDAGSIPRFGNWLEISNSSGQFDMMHFRKITVALGAEVRPGDALGLTGRTGLDLRSGKIIQNHLHMEYRPTNVHDYANSDPKNPLSALLLPRVSTAISIAVVRDTAMDPNTGLVDCHRLTITVDRGTYQNFQINEFQMVGNTTSRTLNWNTRAGLDPADQDANVYDGLYFQPVAFDEDSSQYVFKLYASKAVIGATWVSGYVKDADANSLWTG